MVDLLEISVVRTFDIGRCHLYDPLVQLRFGRSAASRDRGAQCIGKAAHRRGARQACLQRFQGDPGTALGHCLSWILISRAMQHLSVALVDYLRPEMKFDGLQGLLDQMAADCARAREILAEA